jgi:hypothetical protein
VAFLVLSGSALAGTTAVTGGAISYAREVGAVNAVYTIQGGPVTRALAVIRNTAQDFFVDITLGNGALFTGAGSTLPEASDLTISGGGGAASFSIVSGGTAGSSTVRYFADVTTSFTGLATLSLNVSNWTITDRNNSLGSGTPIQITMTTSDSATNTPFDSGTDTVNLATGVYAVTAGSLTSTTATVDVATNRLNFLAGVNGGDTLTADNGAIIGFGLSSALNLGGTTYTPTTTDTIQVVITGTLSGITSITVNGVTKSVSTAEVTAGSVAVALPGNSAGGAVSIQVDGTTQLTARTLTVSSNFVSGLTGTALASTQNHALHSSATLTVWSLNGTILVATWVNGNNATLNARIYLWASRNTGGNIIARVFALPIASSTGTGTPIAAVAVGSVGGLSGRNIRVAEDILAPAGITLPYTTNGGNLVIELTIEAVGVSGISQTFSNSFAYGTYPLTVIQ